MRTKKLFLWAASVILGLPLNATTYYVRSSGGLDTNNGLSVETPFLTLAQGISVAVNGDVIDISGTFYDYNRAIAKSITIHGTDKNSAIFDGTLGNPTTKPFSTFNTAGTTITIENVTFQNYNAAVFQCYTANTLTVKNSIFKNNTRTGSGGSIDLSTCNLSLEDCYFYNNYASASGGAVNISSGASNSTISINRCLFEYNRSVNGGSAISQAASAVLGTASANFTITNSTFAANQVTSNATGSNMGVINLNPTNTGVAIKLINNTIAYNTIGSTGSGYTAGLYIRGSNNLVTLINNILFSNFDSQTVPVSKSINSTILLKESRSNITDVDPSSFNWVSKTTNGATMASGNVSSVVNGSGAGQLGLAVSLADNGGATKTLALSNNSVAINAGYATGAPTIDQRNFSRTGTVPNVGAYEGVQIIIFAPLDYKVVGGSDFALTASASSGLTVSYSSSNPSVATVSGNTVHIVGAGNSTITVNQSGNANYVAATPVTQVLTVKYSVAASANVSGMGNVTGAGDYETGTQVSLTATPNQKCRFINWTDGGTVLSTNASYTFTASSNRTIVANFAPTTYYVRSATGNDTSGDGLISNPYATVSKVLDLPTLTNGDTLDITGTFYDYNKTINKSITIKGTDKNAAIFDGTNGWASMKNFSTITTSGIVVNVENVTFQNYNNWNSTATTSGAVFYSNAACTLNFKNVIFKNNIGNIGGAINTGTANVSIEDSYFYNNYAKASTTASGYGGAIYGAPSITTTISVNRCLFESNIAQGGAGSAIAYSSGCATPSLASFIITNSTFTGNALTYSTGGTPAAGDGAINISPTGTGTSVKLINNTITFNSSAKNSSNAVAGLYVRGTSGVNVVTLINNILFSNYNSLSTPTSTSIFNNSGILLKESRNNITDVTSATYNWTTKTTSNNSSGNTSAVVNGTASGQLGLATTLTDNGGATKVLVLDSMSVAANAGYVTDAPTVDQLNIARIGIPDVGAYEQKDLIAFPSNLDVVGRILCQSIDMDFPGLELVKSNAQAGNYSAALLAWRDYKVDKFRKTYLGPFGWHSNQLNGSTVLPYAQYLADQITLNQFLASGCQYKNELPLFNFNGSPNLTPNFNWLAQNASGQYPDVYANYWTIVPLASQYYKSGEEVYLKKWFQFNSEFACKQKLLVESLDMSTRNQLMCNWTTGAGSALSQSDRVVNMIRSLGVIFKSLPNGGRPTSWDVVYNPVNDSLPVASMNLVPAVQLAQLAFSLVFDHPDALLERYLTAGAVPNQRRAGLTSLLYIASMFPEFKECTQLMTSTSDGIDSYLTDAFYQDGGMLEQSFNYNLGDAAALTDMILFLQEDNPDLAQRIKDVQTAFYRQNAYLRSPISDLPAMSSQPPTNPTPVWRDTNARTTWLTQYSQGIPGQSDSIVAQIASQFNPSGVLPEPSLTSVRFPYSGYYVQRKNWEWDSPYLFFQDARPARGHYNMGHNAIQVYAYGRPLLLSAGQPVYDATQLSAEFKDDLAAINVFFGENSSYKTNSVMVDGNSQIQGTISQTAYTTPIDTRWHSSSNFDFLEGFYDQGYPSSGEVNHRRHVTFVKNPGFWIVADIMTNIDNQQHDFSQVWNFPAYQANASILAYGFKQNELNVESNNIHTSDPTGPNVWLYHVGEKPLTYTTYFGQRNPYLGWFAPSFGNLIPAPQAFAKWTCSQNSVLITIIWPTPNNAAPAFSGLINLSSTNDPSYAGFEMTLQDGRRLDYQISHDNRTLSNEFTSFDAQSLLTMYQLDGSALGMVAGQTDTVPVVFEYNWVGGQLYKAPKSVTTEQIKATKTDQNTLEIYPNPFKNLINIKSGTKVEKVEVFNLTGTLVYVGRPNHDIINLNFLQKGSYIIKCHTVDGQYSRYIVKN